MKTLVLFLILLGIHLRPVIVHSAEPLSTAKPNSKTSAVKKENIEKVLRHYLAIKQSLSRDKLDGVKDHADLMIPAARSLENKELSNQLQKEAQSLGSSASLGHGSIAQARDDFKKISETLSGYLKGNPLKGWSVYHCSMAKADWIEKRGDEMQNPYYGKEMASCGTKVE